MVVNRVTGEKYNRSILGSNWVLVSASTGVKRVILITQSLKKILLVRKGDLPKPRVREESMVVPDLVRSIQLEINYLELKGQKVLLRL